jgi:hypothetical protein
MEKKEEGTKNGIYVRQLLAQAVRGPVCPVRRTEAGR